MEKNIRNNVKYAGTESEIWSDLNELFGKESAPRAYELKQKIASTRQAYHMVAEDERQRAVSNENINPHESAAFKAFQRRNGPLGSNKERSGTKAVKEGIEHCTECNNVIAAHFEATIHYPMGIPFPSKGKGEIIHGRKAMATTVETWHIRLGHASKGKLTKVDFLKTSINDLGDFCDSCAKAKHTRLPFPFSVIKLVLRLN
ncbi:LTR copia-type gag-polypeptide [Tanacetum coccineum]